MSQIVTKFIQDNAVNDLKMRLRNNQPLRARNAADSGDINIIKVNASDVPEFSVQAQSPFTPAANNDIVNKLYVDNAVSASLNSDWKNSVRAATTANITLSGAQTIDGVSIIAGDRVLVKAQTTASENGIYVAASGAWSRATDADADAEFTAMMIIPVSEGTLNGKTLWYLSTNDPIVVGTTSVAFAKLVYKPKKQAITSAGGDITNQYVDLSFAAQADSLDLVVDGLNQAEGVDYSLSVVGGVTRLSFSGDLATGGPAALVAGDILYVKYNY